MIDKKKHKIDSKNKIASSHIKTTPLKAIRQKCLECSNGSDKEVRLCTVYDCPLYPYRMGRGPRTFDLSKEFIEKTSILSQDLKNEILHHYPLLEVLEEDE